MKMIAKKIFNWISIALVLLVFSGCPVSVPDDGNRPDPEPEIFEVVLYATEDTYVSSSAPLENFGSEQAIHTGRVDLGQGNISNFCGLVKFNVSSIPRRAEINEAVLYLADSFDSSPVKPTANVTIYQVWDRQWQEDEVTYFGRPSIHEYISSRTVTFGEGRHFYGWNVTEEVEEWVRGEMRNDGFVVESRNIDNGFGGESAYCTFYSRELSPNAGPQLHVEYTIR